jgi:hypothetical protein
MKVRLIKDARINMKAGEIVEVSPVAFNNLVSLGVAEPVVEEKKKTTRVKKN